MVNLVVLLSLTSVNPPGLHLYYLTTFQLDDKTLLFYSSFFFQVSNYLPSISAAISHVPERYIWRCCIGLHSAPRYLVAAAYFNFYYSRFAKSLPELLLSGLALICSLSENTGLLLLTYVSSSETYSEYKCLECSRSQAVTSDYQNQAKANLLHDI